MKTEKVSSRIQDEEAVHDTLDLRHTWRIVRIHRYAIGSVVLFCICATALHSFFTIPEYKTKVSVSVTPTSSYKSVTETIGFKMEDNLVPKMTALNEYFHSPELSAKVAEAVINKGYAPVMTVSDSAVRRILTNLGILKPVSLDEVIKKNRKMDSHLAAQVMSHLSLLPDYGNSVVNIESTTGNPQLSAFLANAAADALLKVNQKANVKKLVEVKQFLNGQAVEMGTKLRWLESRLSDFQSNNHMISPEEAERSVYTKMGRNEQDAVDAKVHLETNKRVIEQVLAEMRRMRENLKSSNASGSNLYLAQLQHRLSMLQYQQEMVQPDAENTPENKALKQEIESVASNYKNALEARNSQQEISFMSPLEYYQSLEQSLATLKKDEKKFKYDYEVLTQTVAKNKKEFPKLALTLQRLTALKRNIQVTTDLYLALKKKLQETEIQEAATINDISILSNAQVPAAPRNLNLALKLAFAGAVGFFFAIFLLLARETLIPVVRGRRDMEREGVIVLGEVPIVQTDSDFCVVADRAPKSFEADALRALRLRLKSYGTLYDDGAMGAKRAQVILFTSPQAGDGKTFNAVNIAATLAKSESKTLLIDLDLRHPSVRNYYPDLKTLGDTGLDLLAADSDAHDEELKTAVDENLDVIFGSEKIDNPARFLDSHRIGGLIKRQTGNYDYIILDAPPVLGAIDPQMLAPLADIVVLVVDHRRTYREDVSQSGLTLGEVYSRPLLGIINAVHPEFSHFGRYKNYYRKSA